MLRGLLSNPRGFDPVVRNLVGGNSIPPESDLSILLSCVAPPLRLFHLS
jgi:hypothetical protein